MKRFLSLLIALILVFSMFAVTAVAFAAGDELTEQDPETKPEAPARTVEFNDEAFKTYVFEKRYFDIEMSKTFMLDGKVAGVDGEEVVWFENSELLHLIFKGINYIELKDEKGVLGKDDEGYESATKYKLIYTNLPTSEAEKADEKDEKEEEQLEYQVTEHVKLDKAPTAPEGLRFAGWQLIFDNSGNVDVDELKADFIFAAGFTFNMPETNITVKAIWEKLPAKEEDKKDGESEEPKEPNWTVETSEEIPEVYANDIIYILHTTDPKNETKDWTPCKVSDTFSVTSNANEWSFRFAVADGIKASESDKLNWDDVLATTFDNVQKAIDGGEQNEETLAGMDYTIRCTAHDTTHPVVELSESMKNKMNDGLTVGTNYTISTALDIDDASSTKVYYKVYKKVGVGVEDADKEGWLLIYDSKTSTVTEGYEENITTSGTIIPLAEDVTGERIYKIVYSVFDDPGHHGVKKDDATLAEYNPILWLEVHEAPVEPQPVSPVDVWKIILYVIAGLAAAGIVVLLCIKPKQVETADGRYSASANEVAEGSSDGSADQDDK